MSSQVWKVSKRKQQKLSFTDQSITFKDILPSEDNIEEVLDGTSPIIPMIIITEPPTTIPPTELPPQTEDITCMTNKPVYKITEPLPATLVTRTEAATRTESVSEIV